VRSADKHWVCGQQTPEDLVALPGGGWVVASVYAGTGGINLIKVAERASTTVFPGPTVKVELDKTTYPDCPGPPAGAFTTHGVYVEPGNGPVVHGGGAPRRRDLSSTCVRDAELYLGRLRDRARPIGLNAVRGLVDGGFIDQLVAARRQSRRDDQDEWPGRRTGALGVAYEERLAEGSGSEAAGANGIELSADGKAFYLAAWGSQSFIRFTRGATPQRDEIPLGFRVDNIHFAKDGSLLAAGQVTDRTRAARAS
jgi:hypothetical protein